MNKSEEIISYVRQNVTPGFGNITLGEKDYTVQGLDELDWEVVAEDFGDLDLIDVFDINVASLIIHRAMCGKLSEGQVKSIAETAYDLNDAVIAIITISGLLPNWDRELVSGQNVNCGIRVPKVE